MIELQDIVREFSRGKPVLNGVNLRVGPEEVVALLGRNGAGKTTLISIAMGILRPHRGSVSLFGRSPFDHPVEVKRRIGFVGEHLLMPPRATIAELIALHKRLFPEWDSALERMLLDRFDLTRHSGTIATLSRGQSQQVSLLLAVCHRPELLLLDEPASGLDPTARRDFLETAIQLLNREGTAVLFSSHMMADVERLGGRVALLHEGQIRLNRDLDDLREQHCVAAIGKQLVAESAALSRMNGCLHVRSVGNNWHAVFEGTPFAIQQVLRTELNVVDAHCSTVPLEELFIEMTGDDKGVAA